MANESLLVLGYTTMNRYADWVPPKEIRFAEVTPPLLAFWKNEINEEEQ